MAKCIIGQNWSCKSISPLLSGGLTINLLCCHALNVLLVLKLICSLHLRFNVSVVHLSMQSFGNLYFVQKFKKISIHLNICAGPIWQLCHAAHYRTWANDRQDGHHTAAARLLG